MRPTVIDRTLSRVFCLLGALLALASLDPLPAHADAPSPNTLMRLDDRLMRTTRVRITTPSGRLIVEGARVSVEGLAYRNILATFGGEARPVPGCILWEETVRVDRPSNHALGAALVTGLVLGAVAGAATYSAGQRGEEGGPGGMFAVPLVALMAGGVGALISTWHPIYRGDRAPASGR